MAGSSGIRMPANQNARAIIHSIYPTVAMDDLALSAKVEASNDDKVVAAARHETYFFSRARLYELPSCEADGG